MSYRPWIAGECCGVCGKTGKPDVFDGGLLACSDDVRWVCSRACFDVVYPPELIELNRKRDELNNLLFSDDKDVLLATIEQIVPIADATSISRLARMVNNEVRYIREIQEAAESALRRIAAK